MDINKTLNDLEAIKDMERSIEIAWDREATGQRIRTIRKTNPDFMKFFCKHSRLYKGIHKNKISDRCPNNYECANCTSYYDDISHNTVGRVLGSDRDSREIENATRIPFDKVLFYCYWAKLPLSKVLVLKEGYCFNEDGVIIKDDQQER